MHSCANLLKSTVLSMSTKCQALGINSEQRCCSPALKEMKFRQKTGNHVLTISGLSRSGQVEGTVKKQT